MILGGTLDFLHGMHPEFAFGRSGDKKHTPDCLQLRFFSAVRIKPFKNVTLAGPVETLRI
jgi:hypothetical protein